MYYIQIFLITALLAIVFMSIGKITLSLFRSRKISYKTSFHIMWLCTFFAYIAITIGVGLIFLHIATWLGIIVGTILFIGMFLDPNRPISKDVKHSLAIAKNRRG